MSEQVGEQDQSQETFSGSGVFGEEEREQRPEPDPQVLGLLDDIRNENESLFYDSAYVCELRQRLRNYGPTAASAILDDIENNGVMTRNRPDLLLYCGTPEVAHRIGALLADPGVQAEQVLEALRYHGTPENVAQLRLFTQGEVRYLEGADPTDVNFRHQALAEIIEAIKVAYAIRHRTVAANELKRIDEYVDFAKSALPSYLTVDYMRSDSLPGVLNPRFEKLFQYDEPYPDGDLGDYDDNGYALGDTRGIRKKLEWIPHQDAADAKERVAVIQRLHDLDERPVLDAKGEARVDRRLSRLLYVEDAAPPEAPTLGIEIEVFKRTLLPEGSQDWTGAEVAEFLKGKHELFVDTYRAGVPFGADAEWEFANDPVRYYQTLTEEVRALVDLDLISTEHRRHPMHLTIGGVTTTGQFGRGAYVLTRALEATGWALQGGRILRPLRTNSPSWMYRGSEGINERDQAQLKMGSDLGIEIRTFQFQGLADLQRTLRGAYYLGAALKARQTDGAPTEASTQLKEVWSEFSDEAGQIFQDFGMTDPGKDEWHSSYEYRDRKMSTEVLMEVDLSSSWYRLAELLDEGHDDKNSSGGQFVEGMQELVRHHSSRARDVIEH